MLVVCIPEVLIAGSHLVGGISDRFRLVRDEVVRDVEVKVHLRKTTPLKKDNPGEKRACVQQCPKCKMAAKS